MAPQQHRLALHSSGGVFGRPDRSGTIPGFARLRWIGSDGRFYRDLYLDEDAPERKTGAASFTREEMETGFELCGGPSCCAGRAACRATIKVSAA